MKKVIILILVLGIQYVAQAQVAHWDFDDIAESTVPDLTEHNNDGTLQGSPDLIDGPNGFGTALSFDGVNDYVSTSYPGIGGSTNRTIAFWIKAPTDAGFGGIIGWGDSNNSGKTFQIKLNHKPAQGTLGAIRVSVKGGYFIASTDLRDGLWHRVAIVFAGSNISHTSIYIDAQGDGTTGSKGSPVNTGIVNQSTVTIGSRDFKGVRSYFRGGIDDVRFYDTNLSLADIQSMMNGTPSLPSGDVEAYWNFDNISGTSVLDLSGNSHDGTLVGQPFIAEGRSGFGDALSFDGVNDQISTTYGGISGANPRSVLLWVKANTGAYTNGAMVSWGAFANGEKYLVKLNENSSRGAVGAVCVAVQGGYFIGSTDIRDGNWHHITVTLPGTDVKDTKIYVDFVNDGTSGSAPESINTNTTGSVKVAIGSQRKGVSWKYFSGSIDEVRIMSVAMSAAEVSAMDTLVKVVKKPLAKVVRKPISFTGFTVPTDSLSNDWKEVLENQTYYGAQVWWNSVPRYRNSVNEYVNVHDGGKQENDVREACRWAYTFAVAIQTGVYNHADGIGNISPQTIPTIQDVKDKAITLIKSIAKDHYSNGGVGGRDPWGKGEGGWQGSSWSAWTGIAAWLLWDDLSATDQGYVIKMVEADANRIAPADPDYANANYVIDTKAESVGWDAWIMEVACAMMPNHANYDYWRNRGIIYRLASVATPFDDTTNANLVDDLVVKDVVEGYNMDNYFAAGNHGVYPHPAYSFSTFKQSQTSILWLSLADITPPQANMHNLSSVYSMYVNKSWTYGSETRPIYKPDGTLFWTIGKESNRAQFYYKWASNDTFASIMGRDSATTASGLYFEKLHLANLRAHQDAFDNGKVGESGLDHNGASSIANAYLTRYLGHNNAILYPPSSSLVGSGAGIIQGSSDQGGEIVELLEEVNSDELSFYPNPTGDVLNITSALDQFRVILINLITGSSVMEGVYSQNTSLNVSGLQRGIYILSIFDANNVIKLRSRVILE